MSSDEGIQGVGAYRDSLSLSSLSQLVGTTRYQARCSNALPFNLVHFPKGDYPGKLTQREIISEEELSGHLDCLSE